MLDDDFTKLWQSFHDILKSNHYAIHLKLPKCCMSIASQ